MSESVDVLEPGQQSANGAWPWDGNQQSYRPSPDWNERVLSRIDTYDEVAPELDPVTYEVIRNRLWTINIAHGQTVTRVSGSPVFSSGDFQMAILAEDGDVVYNAPFIQFLAMGTPLSVKYVMEHYAEAPGVEDGDAFISTDPWIGNVHQVDVTLNCPVFVDGKLFAWVANAGHQYDLGGVVPGGWPQSSVDVYHDPVALRPFKLVEGGVLRKDLEEMYLRFSRMPDLVALDVRAQLAGVWYARREILALCEEFGAPTVKAAMRRVLDDSQRSFAQKLERIPDGRWSQVQYWPEKLPGDREGHRMQVNLTKKGDRLTIDNEGTDPQDLGPNGFAFVNFSGSLMGTLSVTMLYDQLFAIGGAERQVDFEPTPGLLTCVNHPAAVSAAVITILGHVAAIQSCVSRMLATDPELAADAVAPSPPYPVTVVTGLTDAGEPYGQAILDHFAQGGGARAHADGVDSTAPAWGPLTPLLNAESVEQAYPLLFLHRRELEDSGGAGRWRGGAGFAYAWIPYKAQSMSLVTFCGCMVMMTHGAEGLAGGYPSPTSEVTVARGSNVRKLFAERVIPGRLQELECEAFEAVPGKQNGVALGPDDAAEGTVVGGGGFGDPLDREPERVADDVREGYVAAANAERVYGVKVGPDGELDEAGTEELRRQIVAERLSWPLEDPGEPPKRVAATGEPPRPVHPALEARDVDGERVLACSRCSHTVIGYAGEFKRGLRVGRAPVTVIPGVDAHPPQVTDEVVELRRYCCPGCGVLMAVDVARPEEPPLPEMVFEA